MLRTFSHQSFRLLSSKSPSVQAVSAAKKTPTQSLREILSLKEDFPFASVKTSSPRMVVLDYSSPNIAKPFHAGHLRSTILGNFIANISAAMGHKVHRINYLGDWGTQCGVVLAAMESFGSEAELARDPLRHLLKIYVEGTKRSESDGAFNVRVQEIMRALENGDSSLLTIWNRIRDLSVAEYMKLYKRLGIEFDEIAGESQYVAGAREAAARLEKLDLTSSTVDLPEAQKRLLKFDGGSLYLSRDLAAILDRSARFNLDDMLYIVDNAQHDHFQNVIRLSQHFPELKNRNLVHVKFGRIRGLSTRKGQVVLLSDLIDEADAAMKIRIGRSKFARPKPEDLDSVARTLALSVILINDFRQHRQHDYENANITLQQSEGDSGVFLHLESNSGVTLNVDADFSALVESQALELLEHLLQAPAVAQKAFQEYEPVYIVQYLFKNGHLINQALKTLRVKGQPTNVAEARLGLLHGARLISRSFMKILGLQPLHAM